jgi:hypothetical protein
VLLNIKNKNLGLLCIFCRNTDVIFVELEKNPQLVIPKGGVCLRNLLFLGNREEKQIPRFASARVFGSSAPDDNKYLFRRHQSP